MNSQELEIAKRLGLGFTVVIFNEKQYSLIEKHQHDANLAVTLISFINPVFPYMHKVLESPIDV